MIYEVPVQNIPAQSFGIVLDDQDCRITIYTRGEDLYLDLEKNNEEIYKGVICRSFVNLTPYVYRGFSGSLYFLDTVGEQDPVYTGLGNRFVLIYDDEK